MIEIPKQLQRIEFRFILLEKNSKKPIEKDWVEKNNYKYNDKKLLDWLNEDKNYGVLLGPGNLFVIDIDVKNAKPQDFEKFKTLDTFQILTGGGGLHLYFLSEDIDFFKNETLSIGELKMKGVQVVGPNCNYTNGLTQYQISKDMEIFKIGSGKFHDFYKEFISIHKLRKETTDEKELEIGDHIGDTSRSGLDFNNLRHLIKSGLNEEEIFQQMRKSSIRWLSLPKSKQIWEYKNAKGSLDKFPIKETWKEKQYKGQFKVEDEIKKNLERDTINACELYNQELKPVDYHINKLIPKNTLILIGGNSGEFKTGFALNLILSMIKGSSFLELFPAVETPKILYYEVDGNGKKSIQWKLKYFMNGNNYNEEVLKNIDFEYLFYKDFLKTELENIKNYDIIVLDSYRRFLKGSENDSEVTNEFFLKFLKKAKTAGKTIIVLHHLKKPSDEQELIHAFRGNTDIVSQFDVVFGVQKTPDRQNVNEKTNEFDVTIECAKDRNDTVIKNFNFSVFKDEKIVKTTLKFTGYGKPQSKRSKHILFILKLLKDKGIQNRQEILKYVLENFKCSVPTIDNGLKELVETEEIEKDSYGTYKIKDVNENSQTELI